MDLSQSQNNDTIDDKSTSPKIGINITPCEDSRSSTSDLRSEQILSPSKYKLPISVTDLWRIRRKEKLKKRFSAKSLRLGNDDGDDDSDSYSFDHDSLATPSINTSQIDPSVDSDNGDFSWSSDNSPEGSRSSSVASVSQEESWGSPPYGNMQQDSQGSSEDLLSQEENSRRGSVDTIIDTHSKNHKLFSKSESRETSAKTDTIDKQTNSESSSNSNSKVSECTRDENAEFKQIMRNMTIASFFNKKINSYLESDESLEQPEDHVGKLSNIVDPGDLLSRNYIPSTKGNITLSKPQGISDLSDRESRNSDNMDKIEEKDIVTNALHNISKRDISKLKRSDINNGFEGNVIDTNSKDLSMKENTNIGLNQKERDENSINKNNKDNHITENNYKDNLDRSVHEKSNITQSLEFKRLEKSVGLGIDKSCFWCCEIL